MLSALPLLAAAVVAACDTTPGARPAGDVLLIANQGDRTVHLVETGTGRTLAILPSAPAPHEIAVTADGRWAVATNYGDRGETGHALTVIDVSTQTVARSIDLSPHTRRTASPSSRATACSPSPARPAARCCSSTSAPAASPACCRRRRRERTY